MTHIIQITSDINNSVFENFAVAIEENIKFYVAVHDCNHDKIKESYEIGFNNLIRDQRLNVKGTVQFIDLPNEKNRLDSIKFIIDNVESRLNDYFLLVEDGTLLTIDAAEKLSELSEKDARYCIVRTTYLKFNNTIIISTINKCKSREKYWYTKNSPFLLGQVAFRHDFLDLAVNNITRNECSAIESLIKFATITKDRSSIIDTKIAVIKIENLSISRIAAIVRQELLLRTSKLRLVSKLYNLSAILRTKYIAEKNWAQVKLVESFINSRMRSLNAHLILKSHLTVDLDEYYCKLIDEGNIEN